MSKPIVLPALGAVLILSACASAYAPRVADERRPAAPAEERAAAQPADEKLALAQACASWRWIGVASRSARECPAIAGWTVTPVFDTKNLPRPGYGYQPKQDRRDAADLENAAAELHRFCAYELEDRAAVASAVAVPPPASRELVRLDQDCAAVAPAQAESLAAAASWPPLADHFLAQAGRPGPMNIKNQRGVRLAFLDTEPTGVGVPMEAKPGMLHGYTLTHIARHLVCSPDDSERCAALITTRLALPIVRFDATSRDRTERTAATGGRIGMQSDLAAAILDEVEAWREELPKRDAPQHLVLNLSLAWDPTLFGGLDEEQVAELRAGTQAVYRALRYAEDLGVLVVAAAGNRTTCNKEGPLLPAAWEERAPSDSPTCETRREPLLYAVGGVSSYGQPLDNARVGGMPRRAAIGENAVVAALPPKYSTWLYSGSSMATAVVSATAALVWDSFPDLSRRQVMETLDRSGNALDFFADFWFGGGTSPRAERVSACAALQAACAAHPGVDCPLTAECAAWDRGETAFPRWAAQPVSADCHPWVAQQPDEPPCPPCNPPRP